MILVGIIGFFLFIIVLIFLKDSEFSGVLDLLINDIFELDLLINDICELDLLIIESCLFDLVDIIIEFFKMMI